MGRRNGTARRGVGLLHIGNPYALQQRPLTARGFLKELGKPYAAKFVASMLR